MSTYEEFMIILAIAGLIISILNLKNNEVMDIGDVFEQHIRFYKM